MRIYFDVQKFETELNFMNREFFWDEDVLRIQNEVRRYKNEQRLHDGDVDDKMQRGDGSGSDSDSMSGESRSNFVQNSSAAAERE